MAQLSIFTIANTPPLTTVRTAKPDSFPCTRNVVTTGATVPNRQRQCARPIRHKLLTPPFRQIQYSPTPNLHIGNIPTATTIIADLLLDAILTKVSIANTATTVWIDMNLVFATVRTIELMLTHRRILTIRTTDCTLRAADAEPIGQ